MRQGQTTTPGTMCPTLLDKCVGSLTSPANHVTMKLKGCPEFLKTLLKSCQKKSKAPFCTKSCSKKTAALFLYLVVHMKAVLTSLNTAFLPINFSRSRFKRRYMSLLISLTSVWWFCVNFRVIFGHFGKEIFFLKG